MSSIARMVCVMLLVAGVQAYADEPVPVGQWKTLDEKTGEAKAIIEIERRGEALYGWVDEILDPPEDGKPLVCEECEGELKDAPVIGMTIIQNMRRDGDAWNGRIMDPENGKVYNARMTPADDGQKLEVRGYIGLPLFGRTQIWERVK